MSQPHSEELVLDKTTANEKGAVLTSPEPNAGKNGDNHGEDSPSLETEYPTGWRLVAIAIAIVLSMFLVWLYHLSFGILYKIAKNVNV